MDGESSDLITGSAPSMESLQPFPYHALNGTDGDPQIRLIRLLPGKAPQPVRCDLIVATPAREQSYECLSYCWGDSAITTLISCNGTPFPVTINLEAALLAMRKEDTPRLLWVDAICINQKDMSERNQQVTLMRKIYENACQTVVWLGPEADDSAEAFGLIPGLLALDARLEGEQAPPLSLVSPQVAMEYPEIDRLKHNTIGREAFLSMLNRPWFSRVWIIQEMVVSPKVMIACGPVQLSLDDFKRAVRVFSSLQLDHHMKSANLSLFDRFHELWDTRRRHAAGYTKPLFHLLLRHRARNATDPRDKVYALYGITREATSATARVAHSDQNKHGERAILGTPVGEPDYAIGTAEVYARLAGELLIQPTVGLDLWSAIHPSRRRLNRLPSWAPDWSTTDWYRPFRPSVKDRYDELESRGLDGCGGGHSLGPGDRISPEDGCWMEEARDCPHAPKIRMSMPRQDLVFSEYLPVFDACQGSTADIQVSLSRTSVTLSGMVLDAIQETSEPGPIPGALAPELLRALKSSAEVGERAIMRSRGPLLDHQAVPVSPYVTDQHAAPYAFRATLLGGHLTMSDEEAGRGSRAWRHYVALQDRLALILALIDAKTNDRSIILGTDSACGRSTVEVEFTHIPDGIVELEAMRQELRQKMADLLKSELWHLQSARKDMGVFGGRRFAALTLGYFALVPASGRAGDEVVIFKGGRIPMLVRGRKEVLGECYVHGAMQGELFVEELCQIFTIF